MSITNDREADAAAQVAINPRINLLPNAEEQRDVLGKSQLHSVKKSGLMWPPSSLKTTQQTAAQSIVDQTGRACK